MSDAGAGFIGLG